MQSLCNQVLESNRKSAAAAVETAAVLSAATALVAEQHTGKMAVGAPHQPGTHSSVRRLVAGAQDNKWLHKKVWDSFLCKPFIDPEFANKGQWMVQTFPLFFLLYFSNFLFFCFCMTGSKRNTVREFFAVRLGNEEVAAQGNSHELVGQSLDDFRLDVTRHVRNIKDWFRPKIAQGVMHVLEHYFGKNRRIDPAEGWWMLTLVCVLLVFELSC